jgi:hypothetical protein
VFLLGENTIFNDKCLSNLVFDVFLVFSIKLQEAISKGLRDYGVGENPETVVTCESIPVER